MLTFRQLKSAASLSAAYRHILRTQLQCIDRLQRNYVRGYGKCQRLVSEAVEDGYKRLLEPSIETEFAALSKEQADDEAIQVFTSNLRQLLMDAPLGQKG